MHIKRIQASNYIGISELELDPKKITMVKGPRGSAKSTILEGVEKVFMNTDRRTEVIKHGESEATLFVELDDGMSIERRIRNDKADYLKVRKGDEGVPSTEKFIRSLINGNIFRPIDWVNLSVMEQTKSILNMLKIEWSMEDIENWFGEVPCNVEYSQHILMVLKAIESKYYKDREEVNRQIRELKSQIEVIKKELPANYDGEEWREKKVQEYYNKVSEAQKINNYIREAKMLQEGIQDKINSINANAEAEKSKVALRYREARQDIKDIIDLSVQKIEKAKQTIAGADEQITMEHDRLDLELEKEYQALLEKFRQKKQDAEKRIRNEIEGQKDLIGINESKIAAKEQEILSLDPQEQQEVKNIVDKAEAAIANERLRVSKSIEYVEQHQEVDIAPIQAEADTVANMQSYLRQWDMLVDIRDGKLAERQRESAILTERIETARTMPKQLLLTAQMPIDGISVDENGLIRINGTLIDGLSDGEKLELAMKVAKAQAGELKVICLDRFESLNPSLRDQMMSEMLTDDYQYFVTVVEDTESGNLEIERIGE